MCTEEERESSVDIEANQNARFDKSSSLSLLTLPCINMHFVSDSKYSRDCIPMCLQCGRIEIRSLLPEQNGKQNTDR